MRPHSDGREDDEPPPGRCRTLWSRPAKTARAPHARRQQEREYHHREYAMRPPAPKRQRIDPVADEVDERVDVGKIGRDRERRRAERRLAAKASFGDGKASERVGEVVHWQAQ